MTSRAYGKDGDDDIRFRVIADHVRSSLMLIGDGVTPGNEGRGYVLRRLLRRSVRSMRLMGVNEPSLVALIEASYEAMRESYPELDKDFDHIKAVVAAEEEAFARTLTQGTSLFDTAADLVKAAGGRVLGGKEA